MNRLTRVLRHMTISKCRDILKVWDSEHQVMIENLRNSNASDRDECRNPLFFVYSTFPFAHTACLGTPSGNADASPTYRA